MGRKKKQREEKRSLASYKIPQGKARNGIPVLSTNNPTDERAGFYCINPESEWRRLLQQAFKPKYKDSYDSVFKKIVKKYSAESPQYRYMYL